MPEIPLDLIGIWAAIGLAVAVLAKMFLPGRGWIGSLVVGTVGACAGGLIAAWVGAWAEAGIARAVTGLVAFLGAIVALLMYNHVGAESGLDRIT